MGEKGFENKVKQWLREQGWYYLKTHGDGYQTKGTPDLLCCINGVFVGLELKSDKGRPTPLQIKRLDEIEKAGGLGLVVYPKDFPKLQKVLAHVADEGWGMNGGDEYCIDGHLRMIKEIFWNEEEKG